jgi:microsomal dipeptidase-like Zn-dependent dipeptidase
VFNCGLDNPAKENEVLGNVAKLKNWDHRPLFISIAHHFYNELCGHAESLSPLLKRFLDQSQGLNTGFTDLGRKVLHGLLDNSEGNRIFVDIKHMSTQSRKEYFQILDSEYHNEMIPIIVSHGAVNAWKSFDNRQTQIPDSAGKFKEIDINIYDDEIVRIFDSRGFLGIQLDERRIASKAELEQSGGRLSRRKILFHKSRLIWNQIRHIAEVLDKNERFGWSTAVIGSDFDGIIDPLNGYWTAEELRFLDDYLLKHAYNYMLGNGKNLKLETNRNIDPEEIINRFMYVNAYEFLERYY